MAQNNVDLCNPLAVWQLLIQFLSGTTPAAASPTPSNLPDTHPPPMLREPALEIRLKPGTSYIQVGKPDFAIDDLSVRPDADFKVVKEKFASRAEAEAFKQALPRVRLPGRLRWELRIVNNEEVLKRLSRPLFNWWPPDPEAQRTGERLTEIIDRIPLFVSLLKPLLDSELVILNMGLLPSGTRAIFHPAESIIFIDPFQVEKGILEVAATFIHELTHAKFYHERGFRNSELIPLLSREEYVLVVLNDELAGFKNGVDAVKQFLATCPEDLKRASKGWIFDSITRPMAFYFAEEWESEPPSLLEDATCNEIADNYLLKAQKEYDNKRRSAPAPSPAARAWLTSAEWAAIQGTLPLWQRARVL